MEGFKALGIGFMVLAIVLLVGGIAPYWVYQLGVLFGGLAIAMFICHGFVWFLGYWPLPVKDKRE